MKKYETADVPPVKLEPVEHELKELKPSGISIFVDGEELKSVERIIIEMKGAY